MKLNIPNDLIKETMATDKNRTKTDAVIAGLKELIRKKKIKKVLSMSGKLDFSDKWDKARHER